MLGIIGVLKYFGLLNIKTIAISDIFMLSLIVDQTLRDGFTLE